MKRCFGEIKFNHELLKETSGIAGPKVVEEALIWLRFIPLQVESLFCKDITVMRGYSHKLHELKVGESMPQYLLKVFEHETDVLSYEFELVEVD